MPFRAAAAQPSDAKTRAAMLAAARHMVEKVSHQGGYLWKVTADRSREWDEMEAYPTSVWIQNPGTPLVVNVYLDAYHATGEDYFYRAAAMAADVLIRGQHPSGGWNYHFDLAGEASSWGWYDGRGHLLLGGARAFDDRAWHRFQRAYGWFQTRATLASVIEGCAVLDDVGVGRQERDWRERVSRWPVPSGRGDISASMMNEWLKLGSGRGHANVRVWVISSPANSCGQLASLSAMKRDRK